MHNCAIIHPLHLELETAPQYFGRMAPIAPFVIELMRWSCFPYAIAALLPDLRITSERDGVIA